MLSIREFGKKRKKNMYKNAIFDVDGTVLDTTEGVFGTIRYAVETLGKPPLAEDKIKLFLGPSLYDGFTKIAGYTDEEARAGLKIYRDSYVNDGLYRCKLYDGYPEVFESLKKAGVSLCVASSKPQRFLNLLFDKLDISKYFDRIIGPDERDIGSDKATLIAKAMTDSSAVMIGDRKYDISAARKVGIDVIGITYGLTPDGEYDEYKPDYLAANTDEIYNIIIRG